MFSDQQTYFKQTFSRLTQQKQKISEIEFIECMFTNCNFMESEFSHCSFTNCTYTNCDFSVVKVTNSRFVDVFFKQSKMIGIDWTKAGGNSKLSFSPNFSDSVLNYSSFFGLSLQKLQLLRCFVHDVDFSEANLTEANCQKSDFMNSKFLHTNLSKADFREAKYYHIDPTANMVKKAKFSLPEAMSLLRCFDVAIE